MIKRKDGSYSQRGLWDNIRAVLNDPEDIVRTEVLTQWVDTINPVINPSQWESCRVEGLRLNPEADTCLAIKLPKSSGLS